MGLVWALGGALTGAALGAILALVIALRAGRLTRASGTPVGEECHQERDDQRKLQLHPQGPCVEEWILPSK
jgi:gas vesicle protein